MSDSAAAPAFVKDVSEADFEAEVIERSRTVPVVVDFWAAWCAPCRVLGPLIEREIAALGGRVELAKLDTDQNQALAQEFGIQGIPAVKAFVDGRVVSEFVGLQPADVLRRWLQALVPSPVKVALTAAAAAAAAGDAAQAEKLLRPFVGDAEAADEVAVAIAGALVDLGRTDDALQALAGVVEASPLADGAEAVRRRAQFARDAAAYGGRAAAEAAVAHNEADLEARFALGSALAAAGDYPAALDQFLEIVSRDRKFRDDGARLAMLAIFERLGPVSDVTSDYRRKLQIVT